MTTYDRIKALCDNLNISISSLEKTLNFSNGYFGKMRTSKSGATIDKMQKVADYFGVSLDYLVNGGYYVNEDTAKKAQELFDQPGMRILFDAAKDSKPEDLQKAADFLKAVKAMELRLDNDDS